MKVIGVSSSARTNGNTAQCLGIALNYLQRIGYSTKLIELSRFKIFPCHGCDIECLKIHSCHLLIKDDVKALWYELCSANAIIWGIPNYSNGIPGLLKCFIDRAQPLGYDPSFWKP
ncbi:MAG: flavodoxin family protein, partial [Candidatus Hodarchaeota archaeon]